MPLGGATTDENRQRGVAQTHPPFEGGAALAAGDVPGVRLFVPKQQKSRRVMKRLCATPASYVHIPTN